MGIQVGDNFDHKSKKPLDGRTQYATLALMKAVTDANIYEGCEAYCVETDKYYKFLSSNTVDETTGKWRERESGGSGTSDYSDLSNKPQINGVTLSGNKTSADLGIITKAVNDLVNYYLKSETYSKTEVDNIVTAIKNSRFEVVATLPTSDIKTNVIYLVPKADAESGDIKDEYINLDGTTAGWEKIGSTDIDLSGYVTTTDLNTALANYTTTTDLTALLANKQDKLQYSTLPTASAELEGKIFEYTGATGNGLTHGYFYECVSDGESTPTYSWQQTNVQPSSGGGGSYTAGDGIDITNDVISTKQSESGDIDEIVDVYPQAGNLVSIVNAFNKGDIYSTQERMIGQWTDGKPLYAKTYSATINSSDNGNWKEIGDASDINIKYYEACLMTSVGAFMFKDDAYVGSSYSSQEMYHSAIVKIENGKLKVYVVYASCSTEFPATYTITLKYTKTADTAISIGEATEYSTDEKVVGTWIDGKPLYQKTVDLGTLPNNTTKQVAHGIQNLDIIVDGRGWAKSSVNQIPIIYVNNTTIGEQLCVFINNTTVFLRTSADKSLYTKSYITLQYTKTTT